MKTRVLTSATMATALTMMTGAALAVPRDPSGTWLTQDGRARVRVEKCGAGQKQLCGYVVWARPGGKLTVDRNNPDPAKAGRPILGHQLILGLNAEDDRYAGQIYNAEDGKSYDVEIWVESPSELKVKGCLVAFLCSTQTWPKATDVAAGQLTAATGAPGGPTPDPEYAGRASGGGAPKREPKPKS